MSDFRECDVVARAVRRTAGGQLVGVTGRQGIVRYTDTSPAIGGVGVVWDGSPGVCFERFEDIVLVARPSRVTVEPARQVPIDVYVSIVGPPSIRSLRAVLEDHIPPSTTVDRAVLELLGKGRLARALFETDEAVLQFVDRVSDALIGDEPRDDEERRKLDERVAHAMEIAWGRNELGVRARYEGLIARLLEQLRTST